MAHADESGHRSVSGIAKAIIDAGEEEMGRAIGAIDGIIRKAHNVGYGPHPPEPETIWADRTGRTVRVMVEVADGAQNGHGIFAKLHDKASAARLQTAIPLLRESIETATKAHAHDAPDNDDDNRRRRLINAWRRAMCAKGPIERVRTEHDPFGADAERTMREAVQLGNITVLEEMVRMRAQPGDGSEKDRKPWVKDADTIDALHASRQSERRGYAARAVAELGVDIDAPARAWDREGDAKGADAAREGANRRRSRHRGER